MNNSKSLNCNLLLRLFCVTFLALTSMANAATINILGANPPIPGADDQSQTNMPSGANQPPGLNYYLDNGNAPSQTFTTGNSPNGYILDTVALYDADNSAGSSAHVFTLYIYTVSGGTATLVASYTSQSVILPDNQWLRWTNLGVILQPNTLYAWSMRDSDGWWANVGNVSGDLYPSGQVASIPAGGGTITYSSTAGYDASFDVGLKPITAVAIGQTTFSTGSGAVVPGTSVTASAVVNGPTPYYYQWITDGGSGGALTNIPGATSSNLVIDTTGFTDGYYQYALMVSNDTSSATGQVGVLQIQNPIGIPGVIGVKFAFTNGYATTDAPLPADNTGVPTGQIVPPSNVPLTVVGNWNVLRADVAGAGSQSAAINQAWAIDHDTTGAALSGVTLTPGGWNDGWYSGGTGCAAGRLLYDCWKINNGGSSPQVNPAGHLYGTLTFNNLPWSKYDVIVYVNNNNGNYWGNMQANNVVAQGGDFVDNTSYGFNGASADPCPLNPPLHTYGSYNGGNSANSCNYIKMSNVATESGTITITVVSFGGGDMGVSGVELVPAADIDMVQDLTPNYVDTVTGQPLVLSTAYSNTPPVGFEWYKISNGTTNVVSAGISSSTNNDVVTSSLTFNSLQVSDAAIYLLKVTNENGSLTYTSPSQILVSNLPPAVGNITLYREAQAGLNYYPPTWSIDSVADLIYGFPVQATNGTPSPGTALPGVGDFGADNTSGDPGVLTDGLLGYGLFDSVTCGNFGTGQSVTYFLDTNSSTLGFEITNITVYAGWRDGGRRDQAYQVLYSTVDAPTNYVPLYSVLYLPDDPTGGPIASRTKLIPSDGVLAHNVYGLKMQFGGVPQLLNGYSLYDEIEIGGTNATSIAPPPPPAAVSLSVGTSSGNLILTGSGGSSAANNFYTILGTTNLTPPVNWVTNFTGVVNGSGVFSNSIPVNPQQVGGQYFRVRIP